MITWYERQLVKQGIKVHINTTVTAELIDKITPEKIFVDTGKNIRHLQMEGSDLSNVITAVDALLGNKPIGDKVVVIGGGLTGIELTYDLVKSGKTVEVLEMKDTILDMPDLCEANALMLRTIIDTYNIPIHMSATITKIYGKNIFFTVAGEEKIIEADTIITSIGYISEKTLYETIKDSKIPTHIIGDSNKLSNLLGAVWSAYEMGMNV